MIEGRIWCFWEPSDGIHGYLELCLATWQALGREVTILDNSSLPQYLSRKEMRLLTRNQHFYSLPQYADAVRVMILHRYGGIWMDVDTIVVDPARFRRVEQLKQEAELLMIERHTGWIWASKNSHIIKLWYKKLVTKINFDKYKLGRDNLLRKYWRVIKFAKYSLCNEPNKIQELANYINRPSVDWDYLGNSILDDLIDAADKKQYRSLTETAPYHNFIPESAIWEKKYRDDPNKPKKYSDFYFAKKVKDTGVFKDSFIVCLHNSWTPSQYKRMSAEDFIQSGVLMAELFRKIIRKRTGRDNLKT